MMIRRPHDHEGDEAPEQAPLEGDLRQRFAELRQHDAKHAATFARVVAGRQTPRTRRALVPAMALGMAVVLAIGVGGWWRARTTTPTTDGGDDLTQDFALVSGTMRAPTDYFLDLATTVRADEIPTIGSVDWYPLMRAPVDPTDGSRRRN
jgi:hypothetical protein